MKAAKLSFLVLAVIATSIAAIPASADHFLVVNDSSTTSCDTIEAALTTSGHTFARLDTAGATALTANDVRNTYNGTFWMGSPSSGTQNDWLTALMDAGGNVMVADNDFGYFNNAQPIYTVYFESTYVSDSGSDGVLTGQGIMAGINPDISADPFPDDFTISGTNGSVIFVAPSTNAAGTSIVRTVGAETYRGIYLSWDFVYTPAAAVPAIVSALVTQLSQPLLPVELMSFSIE
jgi:hypothetical protein